MPFKGNMYEMNHVVKNTIPAEKQEVIGDFIPVLSESNLTVEDLFYAKERLAFVLIEGTQAGTFREGDRLLFSSDHEKVYNENTGQSFELNSLCNRIKFWGLQARILANPQNLEAANMNGRGWISKRIKGIMEKPGKRDMVHIVPKNPTRRILRLPAFSKEKRAKNVSPFPFSLG